MVKWIYCIALLAFLNSAQAADEIQIGESLVFASENLEANIRISISVPDTHRIGSTHRYPVLYLLDGYYLFRPVVGNLSYLSAFVETPEMIVVALHPNNKALNFTPSVGEGMEQNSGEAQAFLSFIAEELIPFVDKNYPADDFRVLFGHSISGLFSYWTMNTAPDLFGAYIAISPSLWWDEEIVVALSNTGALKKVSGLKRSLYLNLANEPGMMRKAYENTIQALTQNAPESLRWHTELLPEETHASTPLPSSIRALRWIFEGWNATPNLTVKSLPQLRNHYEALSKKLGYQIRLSENQYNLFGLHAAREGHPAWGVEILEEGVLKFPGSFVLWDSLGEALQLDGKTDRAIASVRKALAAAKSSGVIKPGIEAHLERLVQP